MAPFLSRRRLRQKIQSGESLLNGSRHGASRRLRDGDVLELVWRSAREADGASGAAPLPPLEVLFEDEHLLAVDKPAGVAVHPTGPRQSGTLVQAVHARCREQIERALEQGDPAFYPGLANRLDLFTSGIVLFGKRRECVAALHRAMASREVSKRYVALVCGVLEEAQGSIVARLGPSPTSRVRIRQVVSPEGQECVTHFEVIEHFGSHTLLTGRQHQIRAHLAHIGHPVWGDLIYADEELFLRYLGSGRVLDCTLPPRQALHAERMELEHPVTGERIRISSPLPADFRAILDAVRRMA
jgi:23S rRNA pseudouridine1911/1915/1917 synthase